MFILRLLCRFFPSLRWLWVGIGWLMLLVGMAFWFVCFPLAAFTLYTAHQFPSTYFGIIIPTPGIDFYLPQDMKPLLSPICAAFTLYGLFLFFFEGRKLLRLGRDLDAKGRPLNPPQN